MYVISSDEEGCDNNNNESTGMLVNFQSCFVRIARERFIKYFTEPAS